MTINPANPLVIQSDKSVLLEVDNDLYADARDALARFAELEKSPEYIHTYRISPLSLWNAAAAGLGAAEIVDRWIASPSTICPTTSASTSSSRSRAMAGSS